MESYLSYLQQLDSLYLLSTVIGFGLAILGLRALQAKQIRAAPPRWALPATVLVGTSMRLPFLSDAPWYDETFADAVARSGDWLTVVLSDVHPPTHYAIVRALYQVEDAIWIARLPALLAGIAVMLLLYHITRRLTGSRRAALLASIAVAVAQPAIEYSTEARYPMLLAASVLLAVLGAMTGRRWQVTLGLIGAAWLHALGLVYAVVLGAAIVLLKGGRYRRSVLLAAVAAAPSAALAAYQSGDVANGFWLQLASPLNYMHETTFGMIHTSPATAVLAMGVTSSFVIGGLLVVGRKRTTDALLVLIAALAVPSLTWIVSAIWQPIHLDRSLLGSGLLLLPGAAAYTLRAPRWQQIMLMFAVASSLVTTYAQAADDDFSQIMTTCESYERVHTLALNVAIQALYYAPDATITLEPGSQNAHQWLDADAIAALGIERTSANRVQTPFCLVRQIDYYTTATEAFISAPYVRAYDVTAVEGDDLTIYQAIEVTE